jgi:hypothetical protein
MIPLDDKKKKKPADTTKCWLGTMIDKAAASCRMRAHERNI